jgi:MFS-type transporter involved in bile tolerance (Atg22 family)
MGGDEDGLPRRSAIPLIAAAIITAQFTMAGATYAGNRLTSRGFGRKPLFMLGLISLPIRCALIIWLRNAGDIWLLSTQILDGLGGGFFGLMHPVSFYVPLFIVFTDCFLIFEKPVSYCGYYVWNWSFQRHQ